MSVDFNQLIVRSFGLTDYQPIWQKMLDFTLQRQADTQDEIWLLQHQPVFTQGQAGKAEHLLAPGDIPVVQVDRGGQVTYHGPGQLVAYCLIDLQRKKWSIKQLVCAIEKAVINLLTDYNITSQVKNGAPGIYVNEKKICSLGLRIKRGCSFHGLALNVSMDMQPFERINPCGYQGLKMTQIAELGGPNDVKQVADDLIQHLLQQFDYQKYRLQNQSVEN